MVLGLHWALCSMCSVPEESKGKVSFTERAHDEELADLYAKLSASEAECERLRREVEDARHLDGMLQSGCSVDLVFLGTSWDLEIRDGGGELAACFTGPTAAAARRAAVEYLEKVRK